MAIWWVQMPIYFWRQLIFYLFYLSLADVVAVDIPRSLTCFSSTYLSLLACSHTPDSLSRKCEFSSPTLPISYFTSFNYSVSLPMLMFNLEISAIFSCICTSTSACYNFAHLSSISAAGWYFRSLLCKSSSLMILLFHFSIISLVMLFSSSSIFLPFLFSISSCSICIFRSSLSFWAR